MAGPRAGAKTSAPKNTMNAPAKVTSAPKASSTSMKAKPVSKPVAATPVKKSTPSYSSTPSSGNRSGYAAPSYNTGYNGGGGTSYSGGAGMGGGTGYAGGGDFGAAASFAPEPVMENITIPDPLAQPAYQRAKAEMNRARGDFDAQQTLARSQYDAAFDDSQRQLGWRNAVPRLGILAALKGAGNDEAGFDPNAQGTAYGDAYSANQGDFAGRGLFNSGMYLQALSNMNSNFNDRRASALRDQKDWRDTQELNKKNFYGQQDAADAAAQEDAISAIMASLGVDRAQVTPGKENVISRLASV